MPAIDCAWRRTVRSQYHLLLEERRLSHTNQPFLHTQWQKEFYGRLRRHVAAACAAIGECT